MNYREYLKNVLSAKELTDLLPDKKIFKLKASDRHQIPYCTYTIYDEKGSLFVEGREIKTRYFVQIDINSSSDFSHIEDALREIAKKENWNKGAIYEDIDPETKLMFKCMRFSFELNTEE